MSVHENAVGDRESLPPARLQREPHDIEERTVIEFHEVCVVTGLLFVHIADVCKCAILEGHTIGMPALAVEGKRKGSSLVPEEILNTVLEVTVLEQSLEVLCRNSHCSACVCRNA